MAREFSVSVPDDVADQLRLGQIDDVASYVGETVAQQVRREAILGYLADCESAGHPPLTDNDLGEFRKLVGEEAE